MNRRTLLKTAGTGVFAVPLVGQISSNSASAQENIAEYKTKGNIKQSVSKWCFGRIPLEEFIPVCKKFGMVGIDLLDPDVWDTMLKHDMIVTMGNVPGNGGIPSGFNREKNHDKLVEVYEKWIPVAAEKKVPNLICFSGNREGLADEEGLEVCVKGLKRIAPIAEKHNVNVCMELLNSKDHKDYQCDHTPWGGEVCRRVGSERIKVLYDIYHMQRMEGDLINMIREYKDIIGHIHTGGNPGRKDIDESQEINYPPIMKALVETGFKGFVAHEFLPKNGLQSLRRGVEICDV
ncbi:MAG: TIM barrel protein [Planctomycetaceae bacterium]|nr:TIM barrel protein [Planctomycetaceae bacterium]